MFKWWDKFVDWLLNLLGVYCDEPSDGQKEDNRNN